MRTGEIGAATVATRPGPGCQIREDHEGGKIET